MGARVDSRRRNQRERAVGVWMGNWQVSWEHQSSRYRETSVLRRNVVVLAPGLVTELGLVAQEMAQARSPLRIHRSTWRRRHRSLLPLSPQPPRAHLWLTEQGDHA